MQNYIQSLQQQLALKLFNGTQTSSLQKEIFITCFFEPFQGSMTNVGVEKRQSGQMQESQTSEWDKRRSGQTQDFWDKRRSGQTKESQTWVNFFSILYFLYKAPLPSVLLFFLVRLGQVIDQGAKRLRLGRLGGRALRLGRLGGRALRPLFCRQGNKKFQNCHIIKIADTPAFVHYDVCLTPTFVHSDVWDSCVCPL